MYKNKLAGLEMQIDRVIELHENSEFQGEPSKDLLVALSDLSLAGEELSKKRLMTGLQFSRSREAGFGR